MAEKDMNHQERSFHPDGRYESVINDPSVNKETSMGIKIDFNHESFQKKNPYHITPSNPKEMEAFKQLMKGNKE